MLENKLSSQAVIRIPYLILVHARVLIGGECSTFLSATSFDVSEWSPAPGSPVPPFSKPSLQKKSPF